MPERLNAHSVVTLNLGVGRDSVTAGCLLIEGKLIIEGKPRGVEDIDCAVFSDTGYEWPHTYDVLPQITELFEQHGINVITLAKPPAAGDFGWGAWEQQGGSLAGERPWRLQDPNCIAGRAQAGFYHLRPPILADYMSRGTVVSIGKGDCTDNHKIQPIRKVIEDLADLRFGRPTNRHWAADVSAGRRPPHKTIIGIAADEASRAEHVSNRVFVTERFPLLEMGVAKPQEAAILARWGLDHVRKSGCMLCPFQPAGWYWAMQDQDPEAWEQLLAYEKAALERNPRMFITGRKPLEEFTARWRAQHPRATVEQVLDKTYARGGKGA